MARSGHFYFGLTDGCCLELQPTRNVRFLKNDLYYILNNYIYKVINNYINLTLYLISDIFIYIYEYNN
jgi:hypothetical protein